MFRTTTLAFATAALSMIAGCTDIPQLEQSVSARAQAAPYPALISLESIIASATNDEAGKAAADYLATRSSSLRAKAARLSGDVITPDDQSRLTGGTANN